MKTNETIEQSIPNVKYYLDSDGNGWFCDAVAKDSGDFRSQGCTPEDEWDYDRMFGG